MDILKLISIGIVATIIVITLKDQRPEMAMIVALAAGLIILLMLMTDISNIIDYFTSYADKFGIDSQYVSITLKVIGIAYLAEFAIQACKDAGQNGIGSKIELGAKVAIVSIALPIMSGVMNLILKILN